MSSVEAIIPQGVLSWVQMMLLKRVHQLPKLHFAGEINSNDLQFAGSAFEEGEMQEASEEGVGALGRRQLGLLVDFTLQCLPLDVEG